MHAITTNEEKKEHKFEQDCGGIWEYLEGGKGRAKCCNYISKINHIYNKTNDSGMLVLTQLERYHGW